MEYAPLNSKNHEIRLLLLAPGNFHDELHCALIYTNLKTKPVFEALSYCWGSPDNPKPIRLDGHIFRIGVNLESALRHLRYENAQRILWIDAVCVNQEDLTERSQQIMLMRDVYESAQNVVVWLGDSENESDMALDYMQILAAESTRLKYDYRKAKLPKHNPTVIKALSAFFLRPWFTRIWVLQEIAVSSKASVLCGKRYLSWNELCYASWFLHEKAVTDRNSGLGTVGSSVVVLLGMFMTTRNLPSEFSQYNGNLLNLLGTFQYCDATNPRDKIYALLGLAWDYPAKPSAISPEVPTFTPDYTDSVAQVYTDFAHYQILSSNSLALLSKRTTQDPSLQLPSWVPDWTQYNLLHSASLSPRLPTAAPLSRYLNTPQYTITAPVAAFSPDLSILTVQGYRLAHIVSVEPPSNEVHGVTAKSVDLITDGLMFTLGLTVRAGMRLFGMRKKMEALGIGGNNHNNPDVPHPIFSAPFSPDDNYITSLGPKIRSQTQARAFETQAGEIGVSWAEVRPGDFICTWVGSEHFFAIRDGGDGCWRFVGGVVIMTWVYKARADESFSRSGFAQMEAFAIR